MLASYLRAAAVFVFAISLHAKPAIYLHQVVNAASYYAPGQPGGSIAQGSLFSLFGSALGPQQGISQSSFPLTNSFSGVSIKASQGSTSVNVIPVYVSATQINAIMPSNAPLGWVSVVVSYQGTSNPSPVYVVHDSPGIFTFTGTGIGPAAMQNAQSDGSLVLNSYQASATPGQTEQMYLTGLGPISAPDNQAPPAGNLSTPVEVWVGGVSASVVYSGRSPCCSGLDQIDFVIPANAPQGCWVPVYVRTSHSTISNYGSLAISANGGACSDPSNSLSAVVQSGGSLGTVTLMRMSVHEDVGVNAPVDVSDDFATYSAVNIPSAPYTFLPFVSAPPAGTCTVYPGSGDFLQSGTVPEASPPALDGGKQLTISGPGGQKSVTLTGTGAPLGSYLPLYGLPNQLYLSPGTYSVATSGGANVPAFTTSVTVPAALSWTNRDQITTVDRTVPLTITWSGVPAGQQVEILGVASDLPTNSSAVFFCVVPSGATSFSVPPEALSALPAARANPLASKDVIYLMTNTGSSFSASGLANAVTSGGYIAGKTVTFQ
ncbi:MAG TPA: hypothetical protein VKX49_29955 [Bryobacteraceae bacterium]|nr:hypothetical protein [Bryobacteraceae bacterium]